MSKQTEDTPKRRMTKRITDWAYAQGRSFDFTCDETEAALNLPHQSCSARFYDMKHELIIVPTQYKRPTRTGSYARVFRLNINWDAVRLQRENLTPFDSPEGEEIGRREREMYGSLT